MKGADVPYPRVTSITKIDGGHYTAGIEFGGTGGIGGPIPVQIKVEHFKLAGHDAINVCGKKCMEEVLVNARHRSNLYKLIGAVDGGKHVILPLSLEDVR